MKGLENQTYLIAYIISNAVALLLLVLAWKAPRVARLLFFLLFAWACWTNWSTAFRSPQFYLDYADLTFLPVYKDFILGWFADHIMLAVGFIATCQGLISLTLHLKGWVYKLGVTGGILFLLAILPLGVGAAFPATLMMAIGLAFLWRQDAYLINNSNSAHANAASAT